MFHFTFKITYIKYFVRKRGRDVTEMLEFLVTELDTVL